MYDIVQQGGRWLCCMYLEVLSPSVPGRRSTHAALLSMIQCLCSHYMLIPTVLVAKWCCPRKVPSLREASKRATTVNETESIEGAWPCRRFRLGSATMWIFCIPRARPPDQRSDAKLQCSERPLPQMLLNSAEMVTFALLIGDATWCDCRYGSGYRNS